MFNSFKGERNAQRVESPEVTPEVTENGLDRHLLKKNVDRLLAISTLALANLFTPQAAEAKDVPSTTLRPELTSVTKTPDTTLEGGSYQGLLIASSEMQEAMCRDAELTKCIDEILDIVPKEGQASDIPAYFDMEKGDTSNKDSFVNMGRLDLVLKNFKDTTIFKKDELKPKIDLFGKKLSSIEYERSFRQLQKEIEGLEHVFTSRTNFSILEVKNHDLGYGDIISAKKNLGYGYVEKDTVDVKVDTQTPNPNRSSIGNKEIYVLMKATEPLGKELGKQFSSMVGCDVSSVETSTRLLSSVHLEKSGKVSDIPFNNIHPVFTIEACQKNLTSDAKSPIKMSPFVSVFNNSNGYGAQDLNKIHTSEVGHAKILYPRGPVTDMRWENKSELISPTNRLIITAGAKIEIPILNTNINFVPQIGIQYGYTVGNTKLSPMASFSLVYKKEGSPLNGFEIGLLPAVTKGENVLNAVYFSTKYSITF